MVVADPRSAVAVAEAAGPAAPAAVPRAARRVRPLRLRPAEAGLRLRCHPVQRSLHFSTKSKLHYHFPRGLMGLIGKLFYHFEDLD